jgi:nicotinamidase-related amidase
MTTLENRPNTALLVIDVQNGVVGGAHERDAEPLVEKMYWKFHSAPGRTAGTAETGDVDFG